MHATTTLHTTTRDLRSIFMRYEKSCPTSSKRQKLLVQRLTAQISFSTLLSGLLLTTKAMTRASTS